jgi:hypothetical protein
MNATHTNPFANANEDIAGFDCSTCYDTNVIDHGGREIRCEHCADYRPSAVTVERYVGQIPVWHVPAGMDYIVIDNSHQGPADIYAEGSLAHCEHRATKRKAVIKAAITRRANKAKEI